MSPTTSRTALGAIVLLAAAAGCQSGGVDATYGRSRGPSVNGTGALAELFRRRAMSEPLAWTGVVPVRSQAAFAAAGIDVARLLERGAPR